MSGAAVELTAMQTIIAVIALTGSLLAQAHESGPKESAMINEAQAKEINQVYVRDVKPIFRAKCFDCHSQQTRYPWYHKIPGVKQLIESDIKEGRDHIDFEPDFPFESHATPIEDLDEILEVIEKNEMPPVTYRIMHPSSKLTEQDKETIKHWLQFANEILKKESKN